MGRHRTLDHDRIIDLYRQDYTSQEIATLVGGTARGVRNVLEAHSIETRPGHKRSTLDQDGIISAYQLGKSAEQVAEEFGCSKPGVFNVLWRNNIPTREGAKRHDLIDKLGFTPTAEWLQEQLKQHGTATEVARQYDVKYHTLMDWFYKLGVEVPTWCGGPGAAGSPVRQDIPVEEAIKLSEEGWPYRAIGDKFGVSKGVVMARLKEAGYSAPKDKMRRLSDNSVFATAPFDHKRVLTELGATACQICGYTEYLECAHIFPQNKGGPTVVDNVLALCGNCHPQLDRFIKYPHRTPPKGYEVVQEKVESALAKYGKN